MGSGEAWRVGGLRRPGVWGDGVSGETKVSGKKRGQARQRRWEGQGSYYNKVLVGNK